MSASRDRPPASAASAQEAKEQAQGFRTVAPEIPTLPPGIPFIIGNEAAERFSYYGMRALLVVFMTQFLRDRTGELAVMGEAQAKFWYHVFVWAVYLFPVLGALLADTIWGKYRTIIRLSLVYCAGHVVLACDDTRWGLFAGLFLIALGAGGIKPCVSAHVGDQFGSANQHLLEKTFSVFYFSINFGAFFSSLLTPLLLDGSWLAGRGLGAWEPYFGPALAFGVPGVLMFLATLVFWLGRRRFVHIPAGGWQSVRQAFDPAGRLTLGRISLFFLFVAMFWSLYDQSSSAWVLQAERMNREFQVFGWHFELQAAQVQAINPILVLLFIPLFELVVYPVLGLFFRLTQLRKVGIGFGLTVLTFCLSAAIEHALQAGFRLHVGWQFGAYVVLTAAEVMVSITCLDFAYTQAPPRLKSIVMAINMLAVSLGNLFTAAVNYLIQDKQGDSKLSAAGYYWFFAAAMALALVGYVVFAVRYRDESPGRHEPEAHQRAGSVSDGQAP